MPYLRHYLNGDRDAVDCKERLNAKRLNAFQKQLNYSKSVIRATLPERLALRQAIWKELRQGEPEIKIIRYLCVPGLCSIDVGANIGVYSFLLARFSNLVFAFEPHPDLAKRLRRLLPQNVRVIAAAASDQAGPAELYIPTLDGNEIHSRSSLLLTANPEMASRTVMIDKRRLDDTIGNNIVGIAKIDVEGHELETLVGMKGILDRDKPSLIIESEARHNPGAPANIFTFLYKIGYEGYFIHQHTLKSVREFCIQRFQNEADAKPALGERSPNYVNNFIFVHPTRKPVLNDLNQIFPMSSS